MELVSLVPYGYYGYWISPKGDIWSEYTHRWLTPKVHRCGYHYVTIKLNDAQYVQRYVHQLVALGYIPNPENKTQVNHIDGNKLNNDRANLEWMTNRENAHHALQNGLMPHAVMTDKSAHLVCQYLEQGIGSPKIAEETGIPKTAIDAIRYRRNWTHISDQYTLPRIATISKFSKRDIEFICELLEENMSYRAIADVMRTSEQMVKDIESGKKYAHFSEEYDF